MLIVVGEVCERIEPTSLNVVDKPTNIGVEELAEPLTYRYEAFLSPEYAQAEADRLWAKVWQMAGRVEEIPDVGDFLTYEIGDDSIVVVAHRRRIRSRRITTSARIAAAGSSARPPARTVRAARSKRFVCGFHGWPYDLEGKNVHILDEQDWKGALTEERTSPFRGQGRYLGRLDLHQHGSELRLAARVSRARREHPRPLPVREDALQVAPVGDLSDCNWKTAIEAFMEPYHVAGTHTQLLKYGQFYAYSKAYGLHGVSGFDERDKSMKMSQSSSVTRVGQGRRSARLDL